MLCWCKTREWIQRKSVNSYRTCQYGLLITAKPDSPSWTSTPPPSERGKSTPEPRGFSRADRGRWGGRWRCPRWHHSETDPPSPLGSWGEWSPLCRAVKKDRIRFKRIFLNIHEHFFAFSFFLFFFFKQLLFFRKEINYFDMNELPVKTCWPFRWTFRPRIGRRPLGRNCSPSIPQSIRLRPL